MGRLAARAALIVTAIGLFALSLAACGSDDASSAADTPQSKAAIKQYESYLEESTASLVAKVEKMTSQIKAGELNEAPVDYAISRVYYGQIAPAVESIYGTLAARIDTSPNDVPADELGGFHRIEKGLWEGKAAGVVPVAEQLLADVKELHDRLKTADLQRTQIIKGADEMLNKTQSTAAHGGEEPSSRIDLVDVGANVEGAEAAFEGVKPPLEEMDSDLTAEIEDEFSGAYTELRNFGRVARRPDQPSPEVAGTVFVLYGERDQTEYNELAEKIKALNEGLSQASAQLAP